MHLSPRERASFDEIVARLRQAELEPVAVELPQRQARRWAVGLLGALLTLLLGLGALLHGPEVFAAMLVITVLTGCLVIAWAVRLENR